MKKDIKYFENIFQSQNGLILTNTWWGQGHDWEKFQSQNGLILTSICQCNIWSVCVFQSQNGLILTWSRS